MCPSPYKTYLPSTSYQLNRSISTTQLTTEWIKACYDDDVQYV